jgi:hypothetical protein
MAVSKHWTRVAWVAAVVAALDLAAGSALGAASPSARGAGRAQHRPRESRKTTRYVVVGGGAAPESTEVSLEQDVALVQSVLRPPGVVLFGGGPGALSVRVEDGTHTGDALLQRLGELFQPRVGRRSRYRASGLGAAPATIERIYAALAEALSSGEEPLLLYVAAHGEKGEGRRDGRVILWGGEAMAVADLGALHEAHPRPLRVVIASCFSGGFAELAFRATEAAAGVTVAPRCGLFAGTWDRETSGCDPNPDRRAQESYSLHLLQALAVRDQRGAALPLAQVDIDGDGRVSLLEAHTRARVASTSIDVPTTTSERYLRVVERGRNRIDPSILPEDAAAVQALSRRLRLSDRDAAERRWKDLDRDLTRASDALADVEQKLERRYADLATRLLSRWPVLDDPYHPDFAAMLEGDAAAIQEVLERSPEARAYRDAQRRVDALDARLWELQVQEALVLRLVRAYDTSERAAALRGRGGDEWAAYQQLLACERYVPALSGFRRNGPSAESPPKKRNKKHKARNPQSPRAARPTQ